MAKKHTLALTNNAALSLKDLLPGKNIPGLHLWYKGQEQHSLPAIAVLESLSDVQVPHHGEIIHKDDVERQKAVADDQNVWDDQPYSLELSEKEREACKACVEFYWKQGLLLLNKHLRCLLIEFGLAEE